ncbi:Alpha-N-acetylgalactosaminide alpha-2,6-sialyltransferase 3, partial [Oryzias melastigma]
MRMAWLWKRKSFIATSLVVAVTLLVVVVTNSEKSNFLLLPVFGQTFNSDWMFSKQTYKAFKLHPGYVSIPKEEPLELHCDLCTIVSSSGQMLGQGAGPQIDRSPCVLRTNNAPTVGFEMDVGRRTTVRVVSHTSVPLLLQKPQYFFGQENDTTYVVWGPLRKHEEGREGHRVQHAATSIREVPARSHLHHHGREDEPLRHRVQERDRKGPRPVWLLPEHRLVHAHPRHGHVQRDPYLRHDKRHLLQ